MIVRGDQLIAIIDFEEACHYYRGFDLGMVIVGACRDRQGISFESAGRFIRGYQRRATVQSSERESLKAFAVYAAVATSFWRFRHYHVRRPEARFHDRHVEMQTLADTIAEYPDSSFTELFE
jgi:homoserine kinase type II